jgi:hypothetical protein
LIESFDANIDVNVLIKLFGVNVDVDKIVKVEALGII